MSLEDNKAVVRRFLTAVRDRDQSAITELLADDGAFWVIGELPLSGSRTKTEFVKSIRQLWDIMEGPAEVEIQQLTAEQDRISCIGQGRMVTKAGVPYRNTYHILATVRGGKLMAWREYFDTALVMRVFNIPAVEEIVHD